MGKRGQATGVIIIGLVIVAVVLILLFLRGQLTIFPVTKDNISERFAPIREHINGCLESVGDDYVKRIGLQGGYLKTPQGTFRSYSDVPISYLCYNMEDVPTCSNRMLTKEHMEEELTDAIRNDLNTCLNLGKFKKGFEMNVGKIELDVGIDSDSTKIILNMPDTISRGDAVYGEQKFENEVNAPLGRL